MGYNSRVISGATELLSSKNTKKVPVQKVQESFLVRWHVTLQLQWLLAATTASVTESRVSQNELVAFRSCLLVVGGARRAAL